MSSLLNLKPNIGVYTDPQHNLWIDKADPPVADIESGAAPGEGEVVVEIRSTGICGYACVFISRNGACFYTRVVQTCIFGILGA